MLRRFIDHEFEDEDFLGMFFATLCIEFECTPGEEEVRYTKNGDGNPGSPATFEPVSAYVTGISGDDWDYDREQIKDNGWATWLDKHAMEAADRVDRFDLAEEASAI
jgi:hypothetical protein